MGKLDKMKYFNEKKIHIIHKPENTDGLMAIYNHTMLDILKLCPTSDEISVELEHHLYPSCNLFTTNKLLSCLDIESNNEIIQDTEMMLQIKKIDEQYEQHREIYKKIHEKFFNIGDVLYNKTNDLINKYSINFNETVFLYFRGTDGADERPAGSLHSFFYYPFIEKCISNGIKTFIVQSDSYQFYRHITNYLWDHHKEINVKIFDEIELPQIQSRFVSSTNEERYKKHKYEIEWSQTHHAHVDRPNFNDFSVIFTALAILATKCKHFIGNRGNFSLFVELYKKTNKGITILGGEIKLDFQSDLFGKNWKDEKEFREPKRGYGHIIENNKIIWKPC